MMRLGLCCILRTQTIKFRRISSARLQKYKDSGGDPFEVLSRLIVRNVKALKKAIIFCSHNNIGSFRVTSRFFPLYAHKKFPYTLDELQDEEKIYTILAECRELAARNNIRLTLQPDKNVVLDSSQLEVVKKAINNLEYQAVIADLIGSDTIVVGAGCADDKHFAMRRLASHLDYLSSSVRKRIAFENDDKSYTPEALLGFCRKKNVSFMYDIHHHRCFPDELSVDDVTAMALETWEDREPLFRISSPIDGWSGERLTRHHDFVDIADFPDEWKKLDSVTVEVDAKAREEAVIKLRKDLIDDGAAL